MSFSVGDLVYIQAPLDWDDWPQWTDEMDERIDQDKVHTIRYVSHRAFDDEEVFVEIEGYGYSFSVDWLVLAEEGIPSVDKDSKYYKIIKKIKQLDRKFEQRKELANGF